MPYSSLRDFMDRLEAAGRLVPVTTPVSPHLEMTEIQTRLLAERGPAVLFEHVIRESGARYAMPVLINLFGSIERVAWGMDREPGGLREIGDRGRPCYDHRGRDASARDALGIPVRRPVARAQGRARQL
jgi:4-hydroxy-3-polyprenylbenzoate decarboxylase